MDGPAKSCAAKRLISGARKSHAFFEATLKRVGQPFFNHLLGVLLLSVESIKVHHGASRLALGHADK